jgi:hypothetical protein
VALEQQAAQIGSHHGPMVGAREAMVNQPDGPEG